MQNAGQYVPGAANAHPPQQFVPSELSPNGGSTTSSLRQFRKRDVDKSQLEQPPKQDSHVARVAPHNHYPPVSNDPYRYQSHQFSDYSSQVKYSEIADASQPNPISTSVIQKPKPKEYMEMCNVQQQHINNQQQYSPDNGQFMHRDPTQGYPTGYKPEAHYLSPKDQHQYQQLSHHTGQPKFNHMMAQNMRKYIGPHGPADNPFLNKLSKIHPSMARSIISDHHLQDPQPPTYSPIDQRSMYGQQTHYPSPLHQPNPYAPNPNYPMNTPHHYPNYPAASCNYPRTSTLPPRYSHMDRSISPTRRGYPEGLHMNLSPYHNMPQKIAPTGHNYSPQYAGGPEYAQHYQHRRMAQDYYPQPGRPTQYMQNHHQIPAQEMQELPDSRISPSDSLKKFIENWAADEEPASEINTMESNVNMRDNIKVRDDAPPGTVYMINANDVQYFENNGIPIVTSDNGGLQLTSENYQYLLKNGLVDNTGMVRIIEANKEISVDSSGNHERVVNLQIMETPKPDCMMAEKSVRPSDGTVGSIGMIPKPNEESRRVVIHQNTVINPGNGISERVPNQQSLNQTAGHDTVGENTSISKELVDKNCSPINLDQLDQNLGFSEPDPPETETDKNSDNSVSVSDIDSNVADNSDNSNVKTNDANLQKDDNQKPCDNQNKSPGSKSMPIIDLFGEAHLEESKGKETNEYVTQTLLSTNSENSNSVGKTEELKEKKETSVNEEMTKEDAKDSTKKEEKPDCEIKEEKLEAKKEITDECQFNVPKVDGTINNTTLPNSVIVSTESVKMELVSKEGSKPAENIYSGNPLPLSNSSQHIDNHTSSLSTSECTKDCEIKEEPVTEICSKSSDEEKTAVNSENTENENKSNSLTTVTTEVPPPPIERRKRIFSVDDIIHNIGNNLKRNSKDLNVHCGEETLTTFVEKETEFSSLEQILSTEFSQARLIESRAEEEIKHTDITIISESTNTDSCNELENTKDIDKKEQEGDTELEEDNCEISPTQQSLDDEKISKNEENIDLDERENKPKDISIKSIENIIQMNSDPIPLTQEPEDRSNTPSGIQYQNVIRIEESSVLLQIAGELMEISVNIVNGKKVITVVPLSETTVVDYNDNYELSATVQDSEVIDISEGASEKMEIGEIEEKKFEEYLDRAENRLEEQDEPISISSKEISKYIDGDREHEVEMNVRDESEQLLLSAEVIEYDVSFEEYQIKVQEQRDCVIAFVTNESCPKLDENEIAHEMNIKSHIKDSNTQIEERGDYQVIKEFEESVKSPLETSSENTEKVESLQTCETIEPYPEIPEVSTETEVIENLDGAEIVESVDPIVTINEPPKTSEPISLQVLEPQQITECFKTTEVQETVGETQEIDKMEHLPLNSKDSVKVITDNAVSVQKEDGRCNDDTGMYEINSDKNLDGSDQIESNKKLLQTEESCQITEAQDGQCYVGEPVENAQSEEQEGECYIEKPIENDLPKGQVEQCCIEEPIADHVDTHEQDDSNLDTEDLEYQLEDDVFISEEPSHEIIVTDPLEGVGLVEEIDKTSDSFDIPLEPVTTSDEIVETSEAPLEEQLGNNVPAQVINDKNDNPIKEHCDDHKIINNSPTTDLDENIMKRDSESKKVEKSPTVTVQENKELIVKLAKPEVQILSPTSTNTEDTIVISKENVYLEPRRKFSSEEDDVSESSSAGVVTKAAKKLYDCDLQIPAVTTSGDVTKKIGKKSNKYQHDTVSSSKKERVPKESIRSKKSNLKRSKRINDQHRIKTEQKEILRLMAEKRKQRKESKQKEAVKQSENISIQQENKDVKITLNKVNETEKGKSENSTEHDDEYVDFKELLRARKLKKLKKMQEIKRREAKEVKTRTEDAKQHDSATVKKKSIKEDKPAVVSSSRMQENKAETSRECCIGCSNSTKYSAGQSNKNKMKKRKNSSESKSSDETKPAKQKKNKSSVTQHKTSDSDDSGEKVNLLNASPVPVTTPSKTTAEINNEKSNNEQDPLEIKPSEISETLTNSDTVSSDPKLDIPVVSLEAKEEDYVVKKVKSQKRVSFCADITSSTPNSENISMSVNEVSSKSSSSVKMYSSSTLKDPRRRSTSYGGHVIVPSVSELIEENGGAPSKKKISLADYVSRKRKSSTEVSSKTKSEDRESVEKKPRLEHSTYERNEQESAVANSYKPDENSKSPKKTIKDVKTAFVIHSSDWEDSQSPIPSNIQSNEECLIQDFSGLIKTKSKKPVIDINELNPLENLENPKDKKLQEYKDKVESQLSSLNIQIPKIKSQNLENKSSKKDLYPVGSPDSRRLIKKFLSNEKISQSDMEKIKEIISYKRLMQHPKNARSPSKSPASSSTSTYSQNSTNFSYLGSKSPACSGSAYCENMSDPAYEIKNHVWSDSDSREMRLHLKKVNAKRKLNLGYEDEGSSSVYSKYSESKDNKNVDYSVINRLGKDGLPKIIFKRKRHHQNNITDDNQLVVELERIDDDLERIEEKYNVTVTQMM